MAVKIRRERCKGCGLCIISCPKKLLVFEEEFNAKGHHPAKLDNENECSECGLCYRMCPDFAIYVEEEGEETEKKPEKKEKAKSKK